MILSKYLAAILKYSFQDQLNEKQYKEINEVSINRKGTSRLFVSLGRKDGISPRSLIKMITNETSVRAGSIDDVKVMESFSFMTVPFEDAEIILKSFNNKDGEKKTIIQRANDSKDKPERDRPDRERPNRVRSERERPNKEKPEKERKFSGKPGPETKRKKKY